MKLYNKESECCGCEACFNSCPVNAIEMKPNSYGELFPYINVHKCIKCGKCIRACPVRNVCSGYTPLSAYGVITKNYSQYMQATSGGFFAVLAEYIIEHDGVVFGASLEYKNMVTVKHRCITDKIQIASLQGSKYVQSRIENIFTNIKDILNAKKMVLFCGTPCQVSGLKCYLGKDYTNLYTIDIVCHGVPSQQFLQDHINYIQKKKSWIIKKVEFRKKGAAHSGIDLRYIYQKRDKIKYVDIWPVLDSYYQLFLDGQIYRESCYVCKFANKQRQGDFTICDFWGAESEIPRNVLKQYEIILENGFSGVLINSSRAEEIFKKIKNRVICVSVLPEQIIKWNPQLNYSSKKKECWFEIRKKYLEGQLAFEKWYLRTYRSKIIEYKLKCLATAILTKKIRSAIKKLKRTIHL